MSNDLPTRLANTPIRLRTFFTLVGVLAGSFVTAITMAFLLGSKTTADSKAAALLESRMSEVEKLSATIQLERAAGKKEFNDWKNGIGIQIATQTGDIRRLDDKLDILLRRIPPR
jgi:hypothetical protein